MSQASLTNELTGKTGIQTDHGSLEFGDLIVIMLDLVLLVYTGWRSYDFLTNTVPDGFQMLAIVGLWGLDIGAIGWSLVWMFGSTAKYQDWTAMAFFTIDLLGVILTSVTDALMYGTPEGTLTKTLTSVAVIVVPLVVVGNVVAGFIYHMTSPRTKAMRAARKAQAEHNEKMEEIAGMERDLKYAEQYLLAKQDQVEKSVLLADMKKDQDAIEMATLARLRDRVGAHTASKNVAAGANGNLAQLQSRLSEMANQLRSLGESGAKVPAPSTQDSSSQADLLDGQNGDQQVEPLTSALPNLHPATDPANLLPSPLLISKPELTYHPVQLTPIKFNSKIDCELNGETIKIGDALVAIKTQNKQYKIYKPEASAPFCLVIEDDFRTLQNGEPFKDPAQLADPLVVGGNGHKAALSPL